MYDPFPDVLLAPDIFLRNRSIAKLLDGNGRADPDALDAAGNQTKQCALKVNGHDVAVKGATTAGAGATR